MIDTIAKIMRLTGLALGLVLFAIVMSDLWLLRGLPGPAPDFSINVVLLGLSVAAAALTFGFGQEGRARSRIPPPAGLAADFLIAATALLYVSIFYPYRPEVHESLALGDPTWVQWIAFAGVIAGVLAVSLRNWGWFACGFVLLSMTLLFVRKYMPAALWGPPITLDQFIHLQAASWEGLHLLKLTDIAWTFLSFSLFAIAPWPVRFQAIDIKLSTLRVGFLVLVGLAWLWALSPGVPQLFAFAAAPTFFSFLTATGVILNIFYVLYARRCIPENAYSLLLALVSASTFMWLWPTSPLATVALAACNFIASVWFARKDRKAAYYGSQALRLSREMAPMMVSVALVGSAISSFEIFGIRSARSYVLNDYGYAALLNAPILIGAIVWLAFTPRGKRCSHALTNIVDGRKEITSA